MRIRVDQQQVARHLSDPSETETAPAPKDPERGFSDGRLSPVFFILYPLSSILHPLHHPARDHLFTIASTCYDFQRPINGSDLFSKTLRQASAESRAVSGWEGS